jgi:glucokinase
MSGGLILAGDVGGTKTNLALIPALERGRIGAPVASGSFRSADYPSLESIADAFLGSRRERPTAASFGFAGVVADGRGEGTHVPWIAEERAIARHLRIPRAHLMNDLVATGYGVSALASAELAPLLPGTPAPDGNAGVVAAGTGLGETILLRHQGDFIPQPSEGGHADFAPRTDTELEIFRVLRARFGRVSVEQVLSGPGLANIASVLHERDGLGDAFAAHRAESGEGGLPAAIAARGLDGSCAACVRSLEVFVGVYGAEAGNHALRGVTRSGLYLGGGIAPRILAALRGAAFRDAFLAKEPHRPLMESIPVWVILNDRTAVLGAARFATL